MTQKSCAVGMRNAILRNHLKGEYDEELFVLMSVLRCANVFPCALLLDVDLNEVFAQTN